MKNYFYFHRSFIFYKRTQIFRVMKIGLMLLLVSMGSIYASAYSQKREITLNATNISLKDVIKQIEKQSDYTFFYNEDYIDLSQVVSFSANKKDIAVVLSSLCSLAKLNCKFMENNLVVITSETQQKLPKVSGKVTDQNGQQIVGVTVSVKGSQKAVLTDANGKFSMELADKKATLVFSFIGFVTQEYKLTEENTVNIVLVPSIKSLDEVVVVGYGTQKKVTLTGSISETKGKEIIQSHQPNISNSLAGRFSGMIINNRSGEPGNDDATILVRGLATTGNTDVLVVVDGVPGQLGGLARLDPNDIESVTVLKDASAAVYGSRGANGVFLVTTKRGEIGKPTVSYNFNQGFSSPTRRPHMADAATYATILNEIEYYNNPAGGMNQHYSADEIQKFRNGSDPLNYPNTNWIDETLKKVTLLDQHNISVSGGTDNLKYFTSLGTISQDGLYKNGATNYKQYNFRSNIDANVTDRFKIGLYISGREEDRQHPHYQYYENSPDLFREVYRAFPTNPARYPNGLPFSGIEQGRNPIMLVTDAGGLNKSANLIFNGIVKASYLIPQIDGLSIDGFYSVDKSQLFDKSFKKPYTVYTYDKTNDVYNPMTVGESKASLSESQENDLMITSNIKLNYQKHFGNHDLSAFIAFEQSTKKQEGIGATRTNFPTMLTPELSEGGTAPNDKDNSGSSYEFTRKSYFGRISYDYKEKYMAEIQLRYDGSSIFPEGKQYGYFPAISAGWRISEEEWFKNDVQFVNSLKFRVSYGELGNDNVTANQFLNNYSFNNKYVIGGSIYPGIDLIKLANPDITWEVAKKTDIGFDARLFDNFSVQAIYFKQTRSNILIAKNASIPNISGIVNPYNSESLLPSENIGKVNNGGYEITIGYQQHAGSLSYGISGNMTYAKSKVIFMDEAPNTLDYQSQTGKPLNSYLLYNVIGIFRTQADLDKYPHVVGAQLGDLILGDYNKDGKINVDDKVRSKYGNIPEVTYGFTLSAAWKNIDFSALFSGQARVSQYVLSESGTDGNFFSGWADNRWSPSNTNGTYPRVDTQASSSNNGGLYLNNFWLNNASFLRLKNIELGYTIPNHLVSKIGIKTIRVYMNAYNVFTITKVKDYDPEGSNEQGQFYPQQRIINLGLNVKF